ncbi:MAG TPA: type II toxin-antitoxin system VapC family toxin, partial [Chloroflexota bacterium]
MNLLLDTMALIWWLEDPPRLGAARAAIEDPTNEVYVSAASAWEIATKVSRGRLALPPDVAAWLPRVMEKDRFTPLAITVAHAAAVEYLPRHHRDPFDRLLIAQATVEGVRIVTSDPLVARYDVPVLRYG